MFLRKLTVLVVPLLLLLAVCLLLPMLDGFGYWGNVGKGALIGAALGLLLPLSGAVRRRPPFAALLWVPAVLCAVLILVQYFLAQGVSLPVLAVFRTADGQIVLAESVFSAFMLAQCIRTRSA